MSFEKKQWHADSTLTDEEMNDFEYRIKDSFQEQLKLIESLNDTTYRNDFDKAGMYMRSYQSLPSGDADKAIKTGVYAYSSAHINTPTKDFGVLLTFLSGFSRTSRSVQIAFPYNDGGMWVRFIWDNERFMPWKKI